MKYLRRSPRNHKSTQAQDLKSLRRSPRKHASTQSKVTRPVRLRGPTRSEIEKPLPPSPERTLDGRPSQVVPRVFAIPELLEAILIQVVEHAQPEIFQLEDLTAVRDGQPAAVRDYSSYSELAHAKETRTLFRLQRVNKAFQVTINSSKILRRAMFLEHSRDGKDRDLLQYNPLIFELSPIKAVFKDEPYRTKVKGLRYRCRYNYHKPDVKGAFPPQGQAVISEIQNRARDTNGSWRRTLVSNIPIDTHFTFRVDFLDWPDWKERRHLLQEGATLCSLIGKLVDGIQEGHAHRVTRSRMLGVGGRRAGFGW